MNKDICIKLETEINNYFKSLGYVPNYKQSSLGKEFNFCLTSSNNNKVYIYSRAFIGKHPNGKNFSGEFIENMNIREFTKYIYEHIEPIIITFNPEAINFTDITITHKDSYLRLQDYFRKNI